VDYPKKVFAEQQPKTVQLEAKFNSVNNNAINASHVSSTMFTYQVQIYADFQNQLAIATRFIIQPLTNVTLAQLVNCQVMVGLLKMVSAEFQLRTVTLEAKFN